MDTNAAIAALRNILATLENNEPINRTEGDTGQADLEMMNAKEIREAIAILEDSLSPEEQEEAQPPEAPEPPPGLVAPPIPAMQ